LSAEQELGRLRAAYAQLGESWATALIQIGNQACEIDRLKAERDSIISSVMEGSLQ